MNPTEMHALHEKIFGLMLKAKWLTEFRYTDGKGWHLTWSLDGATRALELKRIISDCGLGDDGRAPIAFTVLAQGGTFPGARTSGEVDPEVCRQWRDAVTELGLEVSEDDLLVFVHVILGWAP